MDDGLFNWFSGARKEGSLDDKEIERILKDSEVAESIFEEYFNSWPHDEKVEFVERTLISFKKGLKK